MPLEVGVDIDAQYRVLRESAGAVERSAGVITVTGSEAEEFLQGQLTNDIEALAPGEGVYAALLDRKGGMQADLRILRRAEGDLLAITEPAHLEKLLRHLSMYRVGRDAEVAEASSDHALISVIGPGAAEMIPSPRGAEHASAEIELGGAPALAVRTDLGVDLLLAPGDADAIGVALSAAAVEPVGEVAAEIVRIESGRPRLGRDFDLGTLTEEAGLNERAVSFTKGCYIGQETVARLHYRGKPNRRLRGLRATRPLLSGEELRLGERVVGKVGSAAISPARGPIALALVRREAELGAELALEADGASVTVVSLPFEGDGSEK